MTPSKRVRTILCSSHIPGNHTLSVVEYIDGRFGMLLDNAPAAALVWPSNQLEKCINAFLARRWELNHPTVDQRAN